MAMDWLKGLVGQPAQFIPAGQPVPTGVPGVVPAWGQGAPPAASPGAPPWGGAPPAAGSPPGQAAAWAPAQPAASASASDARIAALELRCSELKRDLESLALFSRTLLTLLEEKQVATREQFQQMRQKIDMLDGRLDDRVDPSAATPPAAPAEGPSGGSAPGGAT